VSGLSLFALSSGYLEDLAWRRRTAPETVPPDWNLALDLLNQWLPTEPERVRGLQRLLRRSGHLLASTDPLRRDPAGRWVAAIQAVRARTDTLAGDDPASLLAVYRGPLAVELGHIDDPEIHDWIAARFEAGARPAPEARRTALRDLIAAETFEAIMARRFVAKKRFGAEGAESLVPLARRLLARAAAGGAAEAVLGAMHRGRLNLLVNVLDKPLDDLFAEMGGQHPFPQDRDLVADVPYHLGYAGPVDTGAGRLQATLLPNPSHLEAVSAVTLGYARARQAVLGRPEAVLPLVLHTDASVIGQGMTSELLQLSELEGFSVGGAIHLIVNNQIGFTTEAAAGRSSRYCTAPWKALDALILHVNGEDSDAVLRAADLAVDFRRRFARDAVIDLICYRRNGHNEIDEPRFTQPLYYAIADGRPPIASLYETRLTQAGVVAPAEASAWRELAQSRFAAAEASPASALGAAPPAPNDPTPAAPAEDRLRALAAGLAQPPAGVTAHGKLERLIRQRSDELTNGLTWSFAEALAFADLLASGVDVRLTGEDVARGAFSQRHLRIVDQTTGQAPLHIAAVLGPGAGRFEVLDSPLSEYAVLGFEYGVSLAAPGSLVVWEAQFGDFANGAQIMIDQFIAGAFEKWRLASALTLLLPHGLEGQGPEHSSARLERWLQLAARDNLWIVHPSTPANHFHMLRRQGLKPAGRPLIAFTPKKLLRWRAAVSPFAQLLDPDGFRPLIVDPAGSQVARLVFCSGKIVYELQEAMRGGCRPIAVVRLEQLYPFPKDEIAEVLRRWPQAELVWLQEEPVNFGAWTWLSHRFAALLADLASPRALRAIGRGESASPAGSFHGDHDADQQALLRQALEL
jgi:2-oxoglutarate dehydrogenase E1 component